MDPTLVISKALTMFDGTVASGQNRYTTDQIALYEFKTGTGTIAYDTSGVEPELDLNLTGNYTWDQGWGVVFAPDSKAQGTTTASTKLYNMITSTGEFSIEAWVVPGECGADRRQHRQLFGRPDDCAMRRWRRMAFQYAANVRSSVTNTNGAPALVTNPNNQLAQAALQHVVLTYDPVNGRKLYVNGVFTGDVDTAGGGTLANWDNTFALVVGNETSGTVNQFQGELRMVAIHNRALTLAQIQQNYAAGVGQKYFLLFDVSALTGVPQSYIMMTLEPQRQLLLPVHQSDLHQPGSDPDAQWHPDQRHPHRHQWYRGVRRAELHSAEHHGDHGQLQQHHGAAAVQRRCGHRPAERPGIGSVLPVLCADRHADACVHGSDLRDTGAGAGTRGAGSGSAHLRAPDADHVQGHRRADDRYQRRARSTPTCCRRCRRCRICRPTRPPTRRPFRSWPSPTAASWSIRRA